MESTRLFLFSRSLPEQIWRAEIPAVLCKCKTSRKWHLHAKEWTQHSTFFLWRPLTTWSFTQTDEKYHNTADPVCCAFILTGNIWTRIGFSNKAPRKQFLHVSTCALATISLISLRVDGPALSEALPGPSKLDPALCKSRLSQLPRPSLYHTRSILRPPLMYSLSFNGHCPMGPLPNYKRTLNSTLV